MTFFGTICPAYMCFDTGNPNLRSILKPKVEVMVFLCMRSIKIKKRRKCHKNEVWRPYFPRVHVSRHDKPDSEVRFETGS